MTLVLDTAALVALERNERAMWVRLKAAQVAGDLPITHAGILGQVWRGGARQARLSQALSGIEVRPLDEPLGRAAGHLLAAAAWRMSSMLRSCCWPGTGTRSRPPTVRISNSSPLRPGPISS